MKKETIYEHAKRIEELHSVQSEIAQICQDYGLNMTELSKRFGIPYRTIQDWHAGRRVPPEYVVRMMTELLEHDRQK